MAIFFIVVFVIFVDSVIVFVAVLLHLVVHIFIFFLINIISVIIVILDFRVSWSIRIAVVVACFGFIVFSRFCFVFFLLYFSQVDLIVFRQQRFAYGHVHTTA